MDDFSSLMEHELQVNRFTPFFFYQFQISHLLFANELLVTEKVDSSIHSLKSSLDTLVNYVGLIVNITKSSFYFNGKSNFHQLLVDLLGIKRGGFPFTYLGLPLMVGPLKLVKFTSLFDKLYAWLAR